MLWNLCLENLTLEFIFNDKIWFSRFPNRTNPNCNSDFDLAQIALNLVWFDVPLPPKIILNLRNHRSNQFQPLPCSKAIKILNKICCDYFDILTCGFGFNSHI